LLLHHHHHHQFAGRTPHHQSPPLPIQPPRPDSLLPQPLRPRPWRSPEDTVGGLFLARVSPESQEKQPGGLPPLAA
jgi:hypothetical protein